MDTVTIEQVLAQVDSRVPNGWSLPQKLSWLSRLDGQAVEEVLWAYGTAPHFRGYGPDTPLDTPLLIPTPWEECYVHYLEAQIHYINGELTRYANAMALFQAVYRAWAEHYHRSHLLPKGSFRGGV